MAYKKCPRCNLNYIPEVEDFCRVCLVDLGKIAGEKSDDTGFDDEYSLCPECKENFLEENEEICYACRMAIIKPEEKDVPLIEPDIVPDLDTVSKEDLALDADPVDDLIIDGIHELSFEEEEEAFASGAPEYSSTDDIDDDYRDIDDLDDTDEYDDEEDL